MELVRERPLVDLIRKSFLGVEIPWWGKSRTGEDSREWEERNRRYQQA